MWGGCEPSRRPSGLRALPGDTLRVVWRAAAVRSPTIGRSSPALCVECTQVCSSCDVNRSLCYKRCELRQRKGGRHGETKFIDQELVADAKRSHEQREGAAHESIIASRACLSTSLWEITPWGMGSLRVGVCVCGCYLLFVVCVPRDANNSLC